MRRGNRREACAAAAFALGAVIRRDPAATGGRLAPYAELVTPGVSNAGRWSDPITGAWGAEGRTFLELKFDGKRTVSGTTIWRGDGYKESKSEIKTGTFDPDTRILRLEGEAKRPDNGEVAAYVIEGKLSEEGILSGTYSFAGHEGTFSFTRR
ncbi:MAG: hypothetical protein ACE148_03270 [Vicinamibacterales bacterium]